MSFYDVLLDAQRGIAEAIDRECLEYHLESLLTLAHWRASDCRGQIPRLVGERVIVRAGAITSYRVNVAFSACAWVTGFDGARLVLHRPFAASIDPLPPLDLVSVVRRITGRDLPEPNALAWIGTVIEPLLLRVPECLAALVESAIEVYAYEAARLTATKPSHWREVLMPLAAVAPEIIEGD